MTPLVPPEIDAYTERHTSASDEALERLAEETRERLASPQMLSGRVVGRLLETLVFATGARRVLEIGTFSGYSALWMARALPSDGRLVTCEINPEHVEVARRHIDASPYADRIDIRLGPALETLETLDGPFDFVFIDADKPGYRAYYEATLPKLSPTGLMAADNTLYGGQVLSPDGEASRAIAEFNEHVVADPRVTCVMLTVRDGVTVIRHAA